MHKVSRQKTRGHRAYNGAANLAWRFRRLISWLLILVISASPFQASMAMHIDLVDPGRNSRLLIEQSRETAFVNDTQSCTVNYCQVTSSCAVHLNCNPIYSSSPPQLDAQAQSFLYRLIEDEPVSTRFPDSLQPIAGSRSIKPRRAGRPGGGARGTSRSHSGDRPVALPPAPTFQRNPAPNW